MASAVRISWRFSSIHINKFGISIDHGMSIDITYQNIFFFFEFYKSFNLKTGDSIESTFEFYKGSNGKRLDSLVLYEITVLINHYYNVTQL